MTALRPMAFVTFAEKVLRLRLTRGQRVLCRVAFDGVQPYDLEGDDRQLARQVFGDIDEVPPLARRTLALVLGRGSGKTTISAAYGLWRMVTADLSACGPGDLPHVVVIAPSKKTAGLAVRMALGLVEGAPEIKRRVENESSEGFTLRRSDGRLVAFAAFAASRGGASARGISVLSFVLDEAQFFQSDSEFVVTDRDVFSAIVPRLMRGGAGVFISTPWPVPTLMGELHEKNFGAPSTALAALAPTLVMRDGDPAIAELVDAERARDGENAAREFDCDTSLSAGTNAFFDRTAIDQAVDATLVLPLTPSAGTVVAVGADFAFRSDSSALCVVHKSGGKYMVADVVEQRPQRGAPLKPSEVVREFAAVLARHRASYLRADGHYREAVKEHLVAFALSFVNAPEGINGKNETYTRTRALLHEGKIVLPPHPRLLAQLRAVVSKPTAGGGLSITSPRRTGLGHGDLVSAFVLAVHERHGSEVDQPMTEAEQARKRLETDWRKHWDVDTIEDPGERAAIEGVNERELDRQREAQVWRDLGFEFREERRR